MQIPAADSHRIVDVHAHVHVRDYLALLAEHGVRRPGYAGRGSGGAHPASGSAGDDAEPALAGRIEEMNTAGVRLQILSPTLAPYFDDGDLGVMAARMLNDRHAQLARQHPARLAAYVSLPLPHIKESLDELRRGLDTLGMVGVSMHASCLGTSVADERFDELLAEMNRRGCVLFLHPCVNGLMSPLIRDWQLSAAAGPLFEDAVIALHLIVRSVPVRYPDLRIVVPHLGGGLSMMLERLSNQLPLAVPELMARPSEMARTFWYDTVAHGSRAALRCAVEAYGAGRLVPGSDFPVLLSFESYRTTFDHIRCCGLAQEDADRILYANAPALLGSS
jgi:predicted TIM-barrel fold metal-dependent hydrolase